jgi:putative transcriptional regulator
MKYDAFRELMTSVRQAGKIRRGQLKPSRVSTLENFKPAHIKALRADASILPPHCARLPASRHRH